MNESADFFCANTQVHNTVDACNLSALDCSARAAKSIVHANADNLVLNILITI